MSDERIPALVINRADLMTNDDGVQVITMENRPIVRLAIPKFQTMGLVDDHPRDRSKLCLALDGTRYYAEMSGDEMVRIYHRLDHGQPSQ